MSSYTLTIDGINMPTPKREGVVISSEKIWSSNAGRSSSGKMLGNIIAIKTTVQITWGRLTPAEAELIRQAVGKVDQPFSILEYTDINGATVSKTVYFGSPSFTVRSIGSNSQITGATISGIEQ